MQTYPDSNSIVDLLKSKGEASDYYSRAKLYGSLGLEGGEAGYLAVPKSQNASYNQRLMAAYKARGVTPPAGSSTPIPSTPTGGGATPAGSTPTGSPAAPTTDRYARLTQTEKDYEAALGNNGPSEAQLAEKAARVREVTDAINAEYNQLFASENEAGKGRNDRTRALNVSAGLSGSDFASAAAIGTEKVNQKNMDLLTKERAAKLSSAISGVEDRMSEKFRQERLDALAAAEGNMDLQRKIVDEARSRADESIAGIAGSGVSFGDFKTKEPAIYAQLLEEYGGNAVALEGAYNNSLPDDMRTKYSEQIIEGADGRATLHRYGYNPATKKVEETTAPLSANYSDLRGSKVVHYGGVSYLQDADGNLKKLDTGDGPKVKPYVSGKLSLTGEQISEISSGLEQSKTLYNGDGVYVNPEIYLETYNDWVANGGLGKDFVSKFPPSKYVNPANNTLPQYLRSTKAKAPSSSETITNPFK